VWTFVYLGNSKKGEWLLDIYIKKPVYVYSMHGLVNKMNANFI
jgi:hypothetical protein